MKKGVVMFFVLSLFFLPSVLASSIDDELQKVTYYAEEYEVGNINYVQMMVYLSSVRESLNEELGAVGRQDGGVLKQDQIMNALGEPNEWTRWVWIEKEEHEMKLDGEVPIWKKIVFDGKKIQIRLSAFPSLFKRGDKNLLVYRLNFQTEFQKPEEKIDFVEKIDDIKVLAELFNLDSSRENGEALASESVSVEKLFEGYFRRNNENCEDVMKSIFGSENRREKQKILVNEIDFYDGDDIQAIMRLEMCDECEWQWINLDMWLDSRGRFEMPKDVKDMGQESKGKYKDMDFEELKNEVRGVVDEIQWFLRDGDYSSAISYKNKLWMLNDVWNEKSNNIWEEVQEQLEPKRKALENRKEQTRDDWRGLEKLEKEIEQGLREKNYLDRKNFYLSLFGGYDKKEYYFEEVGFEKRLVESFVDKGEEICDNFEDDNENGFSDCADNQCAGKICGVTEVSEDNGIKIEKRDLYCISGVCQLKEYIEEDIEAVCGNHICEEGEAESCQRDCSACKVWDAIECSGNVIFSGEDVNGCPLEPICIEDVEYCEVADDCPRSLCGKSECVENECVVAELTECQEVECVDGQKKATRCESGEIIFDGICLDGIWRNLFISCPEGVGSVCGNDECENSLGEDSYNCPTDCEWTCGNGFCEPFEGGKCDEDCDSSVSDKKDYGEDCSSDDECMYYKCRVGRCSNGNGVGEGCEEDWECESEGCVDGVCSEGGQIIEVEVGIECEVREDCGGVDDVCSNGKCVTLPKVVEVVEKDVDGLEVEVVENDEEVVEEVEEDIENSEESIEEIIEESDEKVVSSGDDPLGPEEDESIDSISITGGTIFNFFEMFLIGITGSVVDEGEGTVEEEPVSQEDDPTGSEEVVEEEPVSQEDDLAVPEENEGEVSGDGGSSEGDYVGGEVCPDEGSPPEVEDNCRYEKVYDDRGCVNGYDVECGEYESGDYEMDWDGGDWEDDKRDEKREWEEERRKREKTCPDECKNVCEEKLSSERYDVERCAEECVHVCVDAGLEEFEDYFVENHFRKEEKGVFVFGGQCRTAQQKTEGFVYFNGWGEPFDDIQPMKQKYYSGGEADWCKWDLENLKKQREEIEKGFNQEFAVWFFEKYLINSAEDWEQHVSGIFELYWNNVDNQREMAHRMQCIGVDDVGEIMDYNLINISYSSEYGSLEYWEEVRTVKVPGMDEKVTIISPYMKVWIFPSKEFIMYEMQKSMKAHEFPGSPEEKSERGNEEGLTAEERAKVKEDNGFMKKIRSVAGKYGGNLGVNVNFVDPATGELVFNVYAQVSEGDILIMKPMLPNESDAEDVRIEIDFDKVYELIDMEERDMRGAEVESPPWDRRPKKVGMVKSFVNEIKMYFKVMGIINSAKVYPESAKRDVRDLFKTFFQMMISMDDKGGDRDEGDEKEMGENPWEEKSVVSGEVVRGF